MLRERTRSGFLLAAILLLLMSVAPAIAQDDYGGDVDYQEFYDELDPYGQWVSDPDYGYVWIPDAGDDFRPYSSNGYWAYTDYGNTWVSNYSWGWAPFHYGRWTFHNYYGWMWIPGNTWGPAWVSWRSGGGNYGWAPLGPGISINIAIGGYNCPDYWWNFAPQQYIFDRRWNRYSYGPRYNNTYINQTTIINNTYIVNRNTYLGGPRRDDLRRATGREPRRLTMNSVRGPQRSNVRGERINMYRPSVASTGPNSNSVRPRTFRNVERPIRGNTPSTASGFGSQRDNGPRTAPIRGDSRGGFSGQQPVQQQETRGFDRGNRRVERANGVNQTPAQTSPDRGAWGNRADQVQPQAAPGRFGDARPQRNVEQAQPQQGGFGRQRSYERAQSQPQPGFDRPQRSFQPQAQPQPQPQRSFQPQPQRSFDQQRSQPMPQPQRMEQPRPSAQPQQSPGGFGGQRDAAGGGRFGR